MYKVSRTHMKAAIIFLLILTATIVGVYMQQKGPVSKKQYYHLPSKTIFAHRKGILPSYLNSISTTYLCHFFWKQIQQCPV